MQNRSMKQGLGKSVWWVRTILIEFLPDILPLSLPPSVSPWVERLFLARKREERERRSEKDLFICSLCFSLLFLCPLPCTLSVLHPFLSPLSLSPSFSPLNLLLPSSPSLPATLSSLSSSLYHSLCLFFCPPPQAELIQGGGWSHGGILVVLMVLSYHGTGCWVHLGLEISADAQQDCRASESPYGTDTKCSCMSKTWDGPADSTTVCVLVRQDVGILCPWCASISVGPELQTAIQETTATHCLC